VTGLGSSLLTSSSTRESKVTIEQLIQPLKTLFAHVFFVPMEVQVNLRCLVDPFVLTFAIVLTLAAVVRRAAAGWSAAAECDRLTVGLGMILRGEEALLFESMEITLGVLSRGLFSAAVLVVMLTALLAALALKWSLTRSQRS
jgi:Kef-type K+ transport system membrane component KefB